MARGLHTRRPAMSDDGEIDTWFRASDRDAAKARVRRFCPDARFYR